MAFKLGTEDAASKKKWLSLRTGRLCLTAKERQPGYEPAFTENKSGEKTHFFAKEFDSIVAYVADMRWDTKEFDNGAKTNGWKIALDTGDPDNGFMFTISSMERPFNRMMSALANCDFTQPVKFIGFKGQKDGNKVLLLSQEAGPDGKPIWIQGRYAERWLDQDLIKKLKAKQQPTDEEKKSLAYDGDGRILGRMTLDETTGELSETGYPYIVQTPDGKWSTAVWSTYLRQRMEEEVIPAIKAAAEQRQRDGVIPAGAASVALSGNPSDDAFGDLPPEEDSELPF